jgi:hypothetical protein
MANSSFFDVLSVESGVRATLTRTHTPSAQGTMAGTVMEGWWQHMLDNYTEMQIST